MTPATTFFEPSSNAPKQICHPGRMSTIAAWGQCMVPLRVRRNDKMYVYSRTMPAYSLKRPNRSRNNDCSQARAKAINIPAGDTYNNATYRKEAKYPRHTNLKHITDQPMARCHRKLHDGEEGSKRTSHEHISEGAGESHSGGCSGSDGSD